MHVLHMISVVNIHIRKIRSRKCCNDLRTDSSLPDDVVFTSDNDSSSRDWSRQKHFGNSDFEIRPWKDTIYFATQKEKKKKNPSRKNIYNRKNTNENIYKF